jgi:hypothetical protein
VTETAADLEADTVRTVGLPAFTVVGDADILIAGKGFGVTVTVAVAEDLP